MGHSQVAAELLRRGLLSTTAVGSMLLFSTHAWAQVGPVEATPEIAAESSDPDKEDGGTILVTGSRIANPNLESTSPVTVVGSAEFEATGTTRTEDLINNLPQVVAGQTAATSNGATGTATVDLRGIGPERTLVLINGRRLMPGDPTSPVADLNTIPAALIERVDVLTGGASSVYGSDAIAGVVNFVLNTDFEGVRLDAQYSLNQHDNDGDERILNALNARNFYYPKGNTVTGSQFDTNLTIGAGFDDDRGHVTAYAGYRKIKPVMQDEYDYAACSLTPSTTANTFSCGGSGTTNPAQFQFYRNDFTALSTVTLNPAVANGAGFRPYVGSRDAYNFAPTNYFQRPDERFTFGAFADYEISSAIHPYLEVSFMDDRTIGQIAESGAFGVVEIERFQAMRATIGAVLANQLLNGLAGRLRQSLPGAQLGRMGRTNLEFAFQADSVSSAESLLADAVAALEQPIAIDDLILEVGVTIGFADAGQSSIREELVDRAAAAVAAAQADRAKLRFADPALLRHGGDEDLALLRALPDAVAAGELTLLYQPRVDARTGAVRSAAGVLHWNSAAFGLVDPKRLLAVAEQTGGIAGLTMWMVERAMADRQALAAAGHEVTVFVPLPSGMLSDAGFTRQLLEALNGEAQGLGMFISETGLHQHNSRARTHLTALSQAGIRFGLQGKGAISLSLLLLKQLPVQELAIEPGLIALLHENSTDAQLVRSCIDLTHALNMEAVGESINDATTLALLRVMGCDKVQGNLIAPPLTRCELLEFLANNGQEIAGEYDDVGPGVSAAG